MKFQKPRGTQDIFFTDSQKFEFIIDAAKSAARKHNYHIVRTPTFEHVELFERNIGEETDAVAKELYRFEDRSGRKLALRPEFTASLARSYNENHALLQYPAPLRMFCYGQLFRYDRTQKGRYREFNQINFESYNETSDIPILALAIEILRGIGILSKTKLLFNYFGSAKDKYTDAVQEYFAKHSDGLSETSKVRLAKSPLRILDSKEEQDIALFASMPKIEEFYSVEDKNKKDEIVEYLKTVGDLQFTTDSNLVRGLDYYTGIVFEFVSPIGENGQNIAVLGGGRYDNLLEQIGKKAVPAIGFAAGIERMCLMLEKFSPRIQVFILNATGHSIYSILDNIQRQIGVEKSYQIMDIQTDKIGKTLQRLSEVENSYAIVIGKREIERKYALLKDLNKNSEIGEIII